MTPSPSRKSIHHVNAAPILCMASKRAAEMRREALHEDSVIPPTIFRGAMTHSAAYLLDALQELGWKLVPDESELR